MLSRVSLARPLRSKCVRFISSVNDSKELVFPWQSLPKSNNGFFNTLYHELKFIFIKTRVYQKCNIISDDELVSGAESAFTSVINGIFTPVNSLVATATAQDSDSTVLKDLIDKELYTFYTKATMEFVKDHKYNLKHSLKSINNVKIIHQQFVVGGSRAHPVKVGHVQEMIGNLMIYSFRDGDDQWDSAVARANVERCWAKGDLTLRFTVEIECEELFCVTDRVTNKVIQGSPEPQMVNHQIILESYIKYKPRDGFKMKFERQNPDKEDDWFIVDIDNWLEGNKYWKDIKDPLKDAEK